MSPCFENREEEERCEKNEGRAREGKVEIISAFKRAMRSEEDTGMR